MYADDFEYDGQLLSNYGFIVCDFNSSNGTNVVETGYEITFNKSAISSGKRYRLSGSVYESCLSSTFDICKNPDLFDGSEMEITDAEFRAMSRWLNRRLFFKFHPIDSLDITKVYPYFNSSFNLSKIEIGKKLYGIRLQMETDSPFGYGEEIETSFDIDENGSVHFDDPSDEMGNTLPKVIITCKSDGDLTLYNSFTGSKTIIKNCSTGEVISLTGDSMIITSSMSSHNLADDFNYSFFTIGNNSSTRTNTISSTLKCNLKIVFAPIIKDTI